MTKAVIEVVKNSSRPSTAVLFCRCTHEFQDRTYGAGRRLHNLAGKGRDKYRCTVCKSEKLA